MGQAGPDERAIVRDMITWAKSQAAMPEARPGETVDMGINIQNMTSVDAASVRLLIYNPDRTQVVSEQSSGINVPAGQSATVSISYTPPPGQLGIYHIDYVLYDSAGATIQPQAEADSGRFVLLNPPEAGYEGQGITFSILTDAVGYIQGESATFTIQIRNHTDTEKTVTARYDGQEQVVAVPIP